MIHRTRRIRHVLAFVTVAAAATMTIAQGMDWRPLPMTSAMPCDLICEDSLLNCGQP